MRELWFSYVDLLLKYVDIVLFGFYVLLCWSYVFGGIYLLLAYLLTCMYLLLVFSQKFFVWETFPQIKFGDASLGIPVWLDSFNMACPGISVIYYTI
jgi:hypothetical protein